MPVFSPKLVLSLLGLWAGATWTLHWISKTEWWLCALGGLGAVLVIWPGPRTTAPKTPAWTRNAPEDTAPDTIAPETRDLAASAAATSEPKTE